MSMSLRFSLGAALTTMAVIIVSSVQPAQAEKIEDNSFLVEEAYNQEAGIIQHIFTYQRKTQGVWEASFTEEVPVGSQLHQLSATIPASHTADPGGESGLGDVLLNYRYQLIATEQTAMAPRLSIIFPSGDAKKSLGSNAMGAQVNLPVSISIDEKWVTHINFGLTYLPGAKNTVGAKSNTTGGTFAASLIHLTTDTLNLMAEFVSNIKESTASENTVDRTANIIFNPGVRYAINLQDLQIVMGASLPIEMVPGGGAVNQFYYVSFEHPFSVLN